MIDPANITNYNRTEAELQEFLIFAICVAGKSAKQICIKTEQLLKNHTHHPFQYLSQLIQTNQLRNQLERVKMGKYNVLEKSFSKLVEIDVKTVSCENLESIPGIGPKTARFFLLHSRPNQQIACLDVHILAWLHEQGYANIPKATPSKGLYSKIEKIFLAECEKRGKIPAEFDLEIWNSRRK